MLVELSQRIQREIEQEVPPTLVFDYPRISDLAEFLVDAISPAEVDMPNSTARPIPKSTAPQHLSTTPSQLHQQVASMSEDEALEQLMRELEE
jgi:hypothetical protein